MKKNNSNDPTYQERVRLSELHRAERKALGREAVEHADATPNRRNRLVSYGATALAILGVAVGIGYSNGHSAENRDGLIATGQYSDPKTNEVKTNPTVPSTQPNTETTTSTVTSTTYESTPSTTNTTTTESASQLQSAIQAEAQQNALNNAELQAAGVPTTPTVETRTTN
jgi:hypothetical protein